MQNPLRRPRSLVPSPRSSGLRGAPHPTATPPLPLPGRLLFRPTHHTPPPPPARPPPPPPRVKKLSRGHVPPCFLKNPLFFFAPRVFFGGGLNRHTWRET